jgi:F-type H+-transporting ATPase subunit delta
MRTIAQHYADALAEVAISQKSADKVRRELRDFLALLRESAQLGVLLGSPAVSRANKHAVAQALVERMGASRTLRNLLFVVIDQRRMGLLPEIQQAFEARLDEMEGVARADVTSARELNERERKQLRTVLERLSGRRVEANYELDPALIAGAVVRVGSTIYDGSVRMQLERLRIKLESQ